MTDDASGDPPTSPPGQPPGQPSVPPVGPPPDERPTVISSGPTEPAGGLGLTASGELDPRAFPRTTVLKPRRHLPVLPILGIVVVIALVAAVAMFLTSRTHADHTRSRAEAFLAAWSAGDTAQMQAMVVAPLDDGATPTSTSTTSTSSPASSTDTTGSTATTPSVAADLKAVNAELHLTRASYTLDSVTKVHGVTTASFTAHEAVAGAGTWTYRSSFPMTSRHGQPLVVWSRAVIHPQLGPDDVLSTTMTWPTRASILGNGGVVLAGVTDTVTIGAEPSRLTDEAAAQQALASTLEIDPATVDAALHAKGVRPNDFVPLATVSRAAYEAAKPTIYPIPGLLFQAGHGNASVAPGFAQALLGTVGPITAEQLKRLGPPYDASSQVGQYGLQATYEKSLAGTPAIDIQVLDPAAASGKQVVATVHHLAGTAPQPLQTTLDPTIQQAADQVMASVAKPSALVAIDADGNVRAVVSGPSGAQFDRALDGQYPPGSTFKVVTTDGLLTAGLTPTSPLTCPGTITVDGKVFHNFESETLSNLSLAKAFAVSCNTAFIGAAQAHLSAAQLRTAAEQFGFGIKLGLGIDTVGGQFPTSGDQVETAADAIGQGQVIASPMQMASVAAAVMTGRWKPPVLLPAHTTTPTAGLPAALSPAVQSQLTTLMQGVVTGGTGTAAAVSGQTVAGKTGTAEFGNANPPQTHAWFIGFSKGLAVAVIVEGGGVGGTVAAPLAGQFFAKLK